MSDRRRKIVGRVTLALTVLLALISEAGPADAATSGVVLQVTTTTDGTGGGTLRSVLNQASAYSALGRDVVVMLSPRATYTLSACHPRGELELRVLDGDVVVIGNGTTIRQGCPDRVLEITASATTERVPGEVHIIGTNLTGGRTTGDGGGIHFDGGGGAVPGKLVLRNSRVTNNVAEDGGGIHGTGSVELWYSELSGNYASGDGGGMSSEEAVVRSSKIQTNRAAFFGGGLHGGYGSLRIDRSSVSFNESGLVGGGGFGGGDVHVTSSTVSHNRSVAGGGIASFGSLTLSYSTVSTNLAEGGSGGGIATMGDLSTVYGTVVNNVTTGVGRNVATTGGSWTTVHTVVAGGLGPSDCSTSSSTEVTAAGNFAGDGSCPFDPQSNRVAGGDAGLGPLTDNGGTTLTHMPSAGSPLRDAISVTGWFCNGRDQRGITRPQGKGCDIGAVES